MAEEIGSIEAIIKADTSDFTRGLLAAEAEAKAFAFDVNKVGTDTDEFAKALKYAERASADASKAIGDSAKLIEQLDTGMLRVNKEFTIFDNIGIAATNVLAGITSTIVGGLPMLGLFAALIVALTAAFIAFTDIVGAAIAVLAAMVAPVSLILAMIGGLAAAFVFAGKSAADGGGKLSAFAKTLDVLHSMFDRTGNILAHVFLPYLLQLAHAGEIALNFFDRIAKLPIKEAFQKLSTEGVQLLTQFINQVTSVIAKPIRLSFDLAFGSGPAANEFQSTVTSWWNRLNDFLFGYTKSHPVEIRPGVFKMEPKTVDGIFQPLIDWFNHHDFTKQGQRIGHTILGGFTDSGASHRIGQLLVASFSDAFGIIAHAFMRMLGDLRAGVNRWGQNADHAVVQFFADAWGKVQSSAIHSFNVIAGVIRGIWDRIVSVIEHPLSISIDWPSPPSWLSKLVPDLGGGGTTFKGGHNPKGGGDGTQGGNSAQPIHVHLMVGEREFGQAIIDTQRTYGRHNAGRMLTA